MPRYVVYLMQRHNPTMMEMHKLHQHHWCHHLNHYRLREKRRSHIVNTRASSTYAGSEENVEVLMEQVLIGLIAETETLQELMRQTHHFMHSYITLLSHSTVHTATATRIEISSQEQNRNWNETLHC